MAKGFSDTPTTMDQERALDNDLFGRVSEKVPPSRQPTRQATHGQRMTCWYEIERPGPAISNVHMSHLQRAHCCNHSKKLASRAGYHTFPISFRLTFPHVPGVSRPKRSVGAAKSASPSTTGLASTSSNQLVRRMVATGQLVDFEGDSDDDRCTPRARILPMIAAESARWWIPRQLRGSFVTSRGARPTNYRRFISRRDCQLAFRYILMKAAEDAVMSPNADYSIEAPFWQKHGFTGQVFYVFVALTPRHAPQAQPSCEQRPANARPTCSS